MIKFLKKSTKGHLSMCTQFDYGIVANPFCEMANERKPSLMMAKLPFSPFRGGEM